MGKSAFYVLIILTLGFVTECTPAPRFTSRPENKPPRNTVAPRNRRTAPPTLEAHFRVGEVLVGVASYYGPKFHGRLTANGETFDMYGITAAHKSLPFNTVVRVTNLKNNVSALVRINDRGPFVRGRMLDLSYGAAKKLGIVAEGTARVKMKIVELGDNEYAQ